MNSATRGYWILLGVLWLATLPLRPLFDPDEGRYAEIPREMAASGDWVTPTLNGLKYFEKPPLQYWATAALYTAFGVHDWTARLWAAALAFMCIPLVYFFTRRIGYSTDTALIAASLLAINPYFALIGQLNLLDQGFTFFLSVAVFSFVIAQRESSLPRHLQRWMLVTWTCLALAVLSKGIVTLVLPGMSLLTYVAITRDLSLLRRLQLAPGLPLFLAITLPWFWVVQSRNPEFFQFFFIREHFARFLTNVAHREEPFWFFIPILAIALLPVIGNWRHWRLSGIEATRVPAAFRAELFLLIWCAVVVVLFSFSQSKLIPYVMPIMPALAVVLARVTQAQPSAYPRAKWVSIGFLLLLAAGLVIAVWKRFGLMSAPSLIWALIVALACVIFIFFDRVRTQQPVAQRWLALAAVSITGYQLLGVCYAASFPARSAAGLASEFAGNIPADTKLYSVGQFRQSLAFYLRRPLAVYAYEGELEFGLRQAHGTIAGRDQQLFLEHWQKETNAIAFIEPRMYGALSAAGMPGRIVARDTRSIVVARS